MSYIHSVLQPGESVRHTASLHWILYVPGVLILIAGVVVWLFLPDRAGLIRFAAVLVMWICFAAGLLYVIWTWFKAWITEIAVTDRRIIYKTGFIRRKSIEINMQKVESVDIEQSIGGRIFDYGDVFVRGTGETPLDDLRYIAAPLELRNHIIAV
jgi:uncharacterized membrane protein YdbT with pleckstrin-like domain